MHILQLWDDYFSLQQLTIIINMAAGSFVGATNAIGVIFLDTNSRRLFMSNAMNLIHVSKGKNIIFTSGAREVLGVRGPQDVMNLATCLGMKPNRTPDIISGSPRRILTQAGNPRYIPDAHGLTGIHRVYCLFIAPATRKYTFKGVVGVVPSENSTDPLEMDFIPTC